MHSWHTGCFNGQQNFDCGASALQAGELVEILKGFPGFINGVDWAVALRDAGLDADSAINGQPLTRAAYAVIIDCLLNPFNAFDVDLQGKLIL